jgi:hypothetical protein
MVPLRKMKHKLLFFIPLFILVQSVCFAIDPVQNFLSLLKLDPKAITKEKVTALLGKPYKVEDNHKILRWTFKTKDDNEIKISWHSKSGTFSLCTYKNTLFRAKDVDKATVNKLTIGTTDISTSVKLLGTPQELIIKDATQTLHYSCPSGLLRLFFRDRTLVDLTFIENRKA